MHRQSGSMIPGRGSSHNPGPIEEFIGRVFEWLATAIGVVGLAFALVTFVGYGGYLLITQAVPAVAGSLLETGIATAAFITGFGWPAPRDLIGDAAAGALVGFTIGVMRFRRRRRSEIYERLAEVFGEPRLATISQGRIMTVGFHMAAGLVAGLTLAWLGIPSPGSPGESTITTFAHTTPLLNLIAGDGAGGFGGPPLGFLTILWFICVVCVVTAILLGLSLGAVSYAAYAASGATFAVSQLTARVWAASISRKVTDWRGRSVMPIGHRVAADYHEAYLMANRDQLNWNLRATVFDAPVYGALTGAIVATIITGAKLLGWLVD